MKGRCGLGVLVGWWAGGRRRRGIVTGLHLGAVDVEVDVATLFLVVDLHRRDGAACLNH